MPIFKLSRTERHRFTVFVSCLFAAVLAWLFFAFSNLYIYSLRVHMSYINSPANKAFHPLQTDTATLTVEGTGWELLLSNLDTRLRSLDVDLRKLNERNYIAFAEQAKFIDKQLENDERLVSINPDTLFFDFSSVGKKKVPVRLAYSLNFKKQYGFSGPVSIDPAYVTVTGPKKDIETIDFWPSDSLKLDNVNKSIATTIPLIRSRKANIRIYPEQVTVKVPVDELTETSVDVPIRIKNNTHYDIKLLPENVHITYMVALSNFKKVDATDFDIVVNLDKWRNKKYKQLPLEVLSVPNTVKIIRMEPQLVDFIVQ